MPVFDILRKLVCCAPRQQEEDLEMAPLMQPGPEPVAAEPAGTGRPYQDYVESEARKYWKEMVNPGSLAKPGQEEIRAAAMPILCAAQRRRSGRSPWYMAHQGVEAMQQHAREKRRIRAPYSRLAECPDYVEALIQLADDADWLAREITLPNHPAPKHPPIYYTIDPASKQAVPRSDALIRGNYVYDTRGLRLTQDDHIYPWPDPEIWPMLDDLAYRQWTACYSLHLPYDGQMRIMIHWKSTFDDTHLFRDALSLLHFSPFPPARYRIW